MVRGRDPGSPTEVSIDMNKPVQLQPTVHGIPIVEPKEDKVTSDATQLYNTIDSLVIFHSPS